MHRERAVSAPWGTWGAYAVTVGGWTLFHLAWQGVAVLTLVRLLDPLVRHLEPARRHALAWAALVCVALAPPATAIAAHAALAADARWHDAASVATDVLVIADDARTALAFDAVQGAMAWLAMAWGCGALVRLALVAVGVWRLRALRRAVTAGADASDEASPVWTTAVDTPMVVGARRPLVLLPAAHAGRLDADEWAAVLAHERAHVERRDCAQQLVQRVLEASCWPHPAVWRLGARLRAERERCCDAHAVSRTARPDALARALVRLAELHAATSSTIRVRPEGGVAAAVGPLRTRIEALLAPVPVHRGLRASTTSGVVASALLALGSGGVMVAAHTAPRSDRLVSAALRHAHVPGRLVTVDAHDPYGTFRVRLLNGRVSGTYVGGRRVPAARLRTVRDTLVIAATSAAPERRLAVDPRGRIQWTPAAASAPTP